GEAEAPAPETAAIEAADTAGLAGDPDLGLMSGPRTAAPRPPRGAAGTWNASINYSLTRPRPTASGPAPENSQFLRANLTLQPTSHWSVQWTTSYSITDGEFVDHYLTLTRDLHD